MADNRCLHAEAIRDAEAAFALGGGFDPSFDRLSEAFCCSRRGRCQGDGLCPMSARISRLTVRLVKYGQRAVPVPVPGHRGSANH
jgi:hypothetical protein